MTFGSARRTERHGIGPGLRRPSVALSDHLRHLANHPPQLFHGQQAIGVAIGECEDRGEGVVAHLASGQHPIPIAVQAIDEVVGLLQPAGELRQRRFRRRTVACRLGPIVAVDDAVAVGIQ